MIEKDITIQSDGNTLAGALCLPEETGRFPTVLMIHGSGALDRDENMKAQQLNVFNVISRHLAENGFASLRYDKRGCGKSSGDYYTAGHADLVDDAVNCVDALQGLDSCERVFILGHSEGCIITPQVSLKRPSVAGLILLCPFVDNMESILMKQAAQLQKEFEGAPGFGRFFRKIVASALGATTASQSKLIDRIKASNTDIIKVRLQKFPAKWLRELIRLDPPAIFQQVTQPLLLIGGEKDLQCDPADVDRIAGLVKGSVESHVIKDLTHVLRFDEGEPAMLRTAGLLQKPIEPIISELVTGWLKKQNIRQNIN